jgi:adenylate kinase
VLAELHRAVDLVVLFEAPDDTLIKRLSGRRTCPSCGAVYNVYFNPPEVAGTCDRCGATLSHRSDDQPETVRRRLEVYGEQTAPLIAYYEASDTAFERIRADRPVEDVYADFRALLEVAR